METAANATHREPWNKGKIVGQNAPFKPKDIWALRVRLQMEKRSRELAVLRCWTSPVFARGSATWHAWASQAAADEAPRFRYCAPRASPYAAAAPGARLPADELSW
jgi:hypothetical protein